MEEEKQKRKEREKQGSRGKRSERGRRERKRERDSNQNISAHIYYHACLSIFESGACRIARDITQHAAAFYY